MLIHILAMLTSLLKAILPLRLPKLIQFQTELYNIDSQLLGVVLLLSEFPALSANPSD